MAAAKQESNHQSEVSAARKQFFAGLFDMSWRLLAAFLIPVLIGVWLDGQRGGNMFTVAGILLGTAISVFVIKKVVSEISKQGGNE